MILWFAKRYPLVIGYIAMENGHAIMGKLCPVKIVSFHIHSTAIFHSYLKIPEGNHYQTLLSIINHYESL